MIFVDVIDGNKTKTINVPTDWEDMTLDYWCGLYKIFKKYNDKSEERKKSDDKKNKSTLENYTDELNSSNMNYLKNKDSIKMNRDIFQYIAKISDKDIEMVDIDDSLKVLETMNLLQEDFIPKGIESFEFEDETYYFPKDQMKNNTFGDYIESTQLDMNQESMVNGKYDVLAEQMAILCRRLGEDYDDDEIAIKTERFKNLTMDIILEFSFFLTEQSLVLSKVLEMSSEEREKEEEEE